MEFKHFALIVGVLFVAVVGAIIFLPSGESPTTPLYPNITVIPVMTPQGQVVNPEEIPTIQPMPQPSTAEPTQTQTVNDTANVTPTSTKPTPTIYYSNNVITEEELAARPTQTIVNTGDIRIEDGNTINTWNVEHANYVEKTHHYIPYTSEAMNYKKSNSYKKIFTDDQWVSHDYWHNEYLRAKSVYDTKLAHYNKYPTSQNVQNKNELNTAERKMNELKKICDQLCVDCRYCKYYWRGSQ